MSERLTIASGQLIMFALLDGNVCALSVVQIRSEVDSQHVHRVRMLRKTQLRTNSPTHSHLTFAMVVTAGMRRARCSRALVALVR